MAGCLAWLFAPDNATPNKAVRFRKSEKPPLEIQARHIFLQKIFAPDQFARNPCGGQRNPVFAREKAIFDEMLALKI